MDCKGKDMVTIPRREKQRIIDTINDTKKTYMDVIDTARQRLTMPRKMIIPPRRS